LARLVFSSWFLAKRLIWTFSALLKFLLGVVDESSTKKGHTSGIFSNSIFFFHSYSFGNRHTSCRICAIILSLWLQYHVIILFFYNMMMRKHTPVVIKLTERIRFVGRPISTKDIRKFIMFYEYKAR
jgi:hypothetical protein